MFIQQGLELTLLFSWQNLLLVCFYQQEFQQCELLQHFVSVCVGQVRGLVSELWRLH